MQNETLERRRFLQGLMAAGAVGPMAQAQEKKVRIGIIGLGWRGKSNGDDIQKLAEKGYPVEITAVCDLYQPRLERAETRYKARGYEHTADMLKNAPLDAVLIATPDRHHLYNLQEAIRAGKDVYVEKPLCHWAQFDLLKSVVHENRKLNRIVQVGSQHVADSVWGKAAEMLAGGGIGTPVHIQVPNFRNSDGGERSPTFIDDPNAKAGVGLNWEKWQGDAPRHEFTIERFFQWRMFGDYSGGPVTDTGVHSISPVYKILEKLNVGMPQKVMATGGRFYYGEPRTAPDTMDVLMQYPQNFTVALLETYVNNQFPIETVIRCAEGSIVRRPEGVEFVPMAREGMGSLTPGVQKVEAKPPTLIRSDAAEQLAAEGGQRRYIDQTGAHIQDFLDAVRTRKQPRYNLEMGYIVQTPFCMAMRSLLENKVALWDPQREEIRMS
jgi:predicted dehydrogenase